MPKLKNGLKRFKTAVSKAFEMEKEAAFEPTEQQMELLEKVAKWLVRRKLTVPALMFLESVIPMNFMANQAMVFFNPFVTAFLSSKDYKAFQDMLEYRESIPIFINVIETQEAKWNERKRETETSKHSAKE